MFLSQVKLKWKMILSWMGSEILGEGILKLVLINDWLFLPVNRKYALNQEKSWSAPTATYVELHPLETTSMNLRSGFQSKKYELVENIKSCGMIVLALLDVTMRVICIVRILILSSLESSTICHRFVNKRMLKRWEGIILMCVEMVRDYWNFEKILCTSQ